MTEKKHTKKEPRKVLIEFLQYWKRGNKKQMHSRTSKTWQSRYSKNAFQGDGLKSFEIGEEKLNKNVCDFKIKLNGEPHTVRLLCEDAEYKASENGDWGVFPGSFRVVKQMGL
jgi:hypothetical protein